MLNVFTDSMLYERSEVTELTLLLSTIDIVIKKTPCHKQCLSVGKTRQRDTHHRSLEEFPIQYQQLYQR